jgi:Tol biopolymer transport system component
MTTLLASCAPTSAPDSSLSDISDAFVVLQRDGRIVRSDGAAIADTVGTETMSSVVTTGGLVTTRGEEIVLVPLTGEKPRVILEHRSNVRFAELSPDGSMLAFSSSDAPQIFLATRDARGEFTEPKPIARGYGPSFSHDGRFIYFEAGEAGLSRFDLREAKTSPFLLDDRGAHTVRCSRDGKWIAFSMDRALYLYRCEDKSVRKLTDGGAYDRFPSFAGNHILFYRETKAGEEQVVTINVDASNERVLYRGDVMSVCSLPATKR